MWIVVTIMGCFLLTIVLNTVAAPLRERVTLVRTPDRLVLRNQQAALRLDSIVLTMYLIGLACALVVRSPVAIAFASVAVAVAGWRLMSARRAPTYVFDRTADLLRRGKRVICLLSAIDGLTLTPEGGPAGAVSALELHFHDPRGQHGRQILYQARPEQAGALRAAVMDFLKEGGHFERS